MKLLTIVFVLHLLIQDSSQCDPVQDTPPCVCSLNDKNIDLRSLANIDNAAKVNAFKIDNASDYNSYSYNPCTAFSDGSCIEVAGCQDGGDAKRSIGIQDNAQFINDSNGDISISYTGGNGGRSMIVNLRCGEIGPAKFEFVGETELHQYTFTLTTICACPGGCDWKGPTGGGEGEAKSHNSNLGLPGFIILSVFFFGIIVYFVAGMIIMRVKYEKTGSDIIPNKGFWMALPSLVKDGVVFTFTPCIHLVSVKGGYYKVP